MITVDNLKKVLIDGWQYIQAGKAVYVKEYTEYSCSIKVDFNNKRIIYPVDKGI